MTPQQALALIERAGDDRVERTAAYFQVVGDAELIGQLLDLDRTAREEFVGLVKAKASGCKISVLNAALTEARKKKIATRKDGSAGTIFDLPLPAGYHLDSGTGRLIHTVAKDDGVVELLTAYRPLAITSRVVDPVEGRLHVEVSWETSGGVKERAIIPRASAVDTRGLCAALAGVGVEGAPVNSRNAGPVVEYLTAQEDAAGTDLPTSILTRSMGWVTMPPGHPPCYLAGDVLLQPTDSRLTIEPEPSAGLRSLAARVRQSGDLPGWADAIVPVSAAHPTIGLVVIASLAPALLQVITSAPSSGLLDIAGPQGTGKTTAMEVAISCWGPPSRFAGPMISLSGTSAGLREYRMAMGSGMPLALNDTQNARNDPAELIALIFGIYEGIDKVRMGAVGGGLQAMRSTRTGALLTGNTALVDLLPDVEGVLTRIITIREAPFGTSSKASYAIITALMQALHQHHGTAGPALVSWLLTMRPEWPRLVDSWRKRVAHWSGTIGAGAERYAEVLSIYDLTGGIISKALAPGFDPHPCVALAAAAASAGTEGLDTPRRALRLVAGWAAPRQLYFYASGQAPPPGGVWLGRWERTPGAPLCIGKNALCDFLRLNKLQVEDTLSAWQKRGWLQAEPGRRTTRVMYLGQRSEHYVLTPEALAVAGLSRDAEDADDRPTPPIAQAWA